MQPKNLLPLKNTGPRAASAASRDPRRAGAWDRVVVHTAPSTTKFELKQFLSKVYGLDVKKVNTINMEGKVVSRYAGRKLYKKKRNADYKKAFVKVARDPAGNDVGSDAEEHFDIPLVDGVIPPPELGKYKKNQAKWGQVTRRQFVNIVDSAQALLEEGSVEDALDDISLAIDLESKSIEHHQRGLELVRDADDDDKLAMVSAIRQAIADEDTAAEETVLIRGDNPLTVSLPKGPRKRHGRRSKGRGRSGKNQTGRPHR